MTSTADSGSGCAGGPVEMQPRPEPEPHQLGYSRHYVLVGLLDDQVRHVLGPWFYLSHAQEQLLDTAEQHPDFEWHIHPLKDSLS